MYNLIGFAVWQVQTRKRYIYSKENSYPFTTDLLNISSHQHGFIIELQNRTSDDKYPRFDRRYH